MLFRSGFSTLHGGPGSGPFIRSVTGLCFEPKALIVTVPAAGATGFGTVGQRAYFYTSFVAQLGSEYGLRSEWDAGAVFFKESQGGVLGFGSGLDATVVSYDASGFTLSLPSSGDHYFYWMAFGGDNLEAYVGSFTVTAGSTASIPVTGVGFEPDFLFCQTGVNPNTIAASVSYGMASDPADQASMSGARGLFSGNSANLLSDYLLCPRQTYAGGNSANFRAALASFDADGFTLDVPFNTGTGNQPAHFLALKDTDAQFKVGVDTQKTSVGTKATTGVGFAGGGGIFLGSKQTVDNDLSTYPGPPTFSVGAVDGLGNQVVVEEFNRIGGAGSTQNTYASDASVIAISEPNTTMDAEAEFVSFDADGFTLDWTTADATARYFVYGVFETDYPDPCDPPVPFVPAYQRMYGWRASIDDNALETVEVFVSPQGFTS